MQENPKPEQRQQEKSTQEESSDETRFLSREERTYMKKFYTDPHCRINDLIEQLLMLRKAHGNIKVLITDKDQFEGRPFIVEKLGYKDTVESLFICDKDQLEDIRNAEKEYFSSTPSL